MHSASQSRVQKNSITEILASTSSPSTFTLRECHEVLIELTISRSTNPQLDLFADIDMSIADANIDLSHHPAAGSEGKNKVALRCRFPDCPEDREFFTESALKYVVTFYPKALPRGCTNFWLAGSMRVSTTNLLLAP